MLNRPTINRARFLLLLRAPLFFDPLLLSCVLLDDRSGADNCRATASSCCCTRRRLLRVTCSVLTGLHVIGTRRIHLKNVKYFKPLSPCMSRIFSGHILLDRLRIRVVKATRMSVTMMTMLSRRGQKRTTKKHCFSFPSPRLAWFAPFGREAGSEWKVALVSLNDGHTWTKRSTLLGRGTMEALYSRFLACLAAKLANRSHTSRSLSSVGQITWERRACEALLTPESRAPSPRYATRRVGGWVGDLPAGHS
jgi:hypothetical protein